MGAAGVVAAPAAADNMFRGVEYPGPLRAEEGRLVDRQGRTVLLRGVNVNQLGDYFQGNPEIPPVMPFSRDDMARISALGANVVRLLVHWSALEPEPGVHDEAYLARIDEAVGWAWDFGLHVVLDMHQDAWGKFIASDPQDSCGIVWQPNIGWDGAPEWATLTGGRSRCALLGVRELSPAVATAWQAFWDNDEGIQDHFVDTWAWLAAHFKDDPGVVGYDLVNEPHWGIRYLPTLLLQKPRLYGRLVEEIRAAGGDDKLIFFEPFGLWSALPGEVPVRFTSDSQIVYAPHIYVGSISLDVVLTGREILPLEFGFFEANREAFVYGAPLWIGEWGWFGEESDYADRFAALEDLMGVGSAFWQWKQSCGDPHGLDWPGGEPPATSGNLVEVVCGNPSAPEGVEVGLNETHARALSRPYLRRFPGTARFTSDPDTRRIVAEGEAQPGDPPLEVWIPGRENPVYEAEGLEPVRTSGIPGGWVLYLAPTADRWWLDAIGSD